MSPRALPIADLQLVAGILAHAAVLPVGHDHKRRYLMTQITRIIGGDRWVWCRGDGSNPAAAPLRVIDCGRTDDESPSETRASFEHEFEPLLLTALDPAPRASTASPARKFLVTQCRLAQQGHISRFIIRASGSHRFTPRDQCVLDMVCEEVPWLHSVQTGPSAARISLPPRLGQVLERLRAGDSAKQVAHHLGISRHTANDYIKILYSRFNVSSRAALLARFLGQEANQGQ